MDGSNYGLITAGEPAETRQPIAGRHCNNLGPAYHQSAGAGRGSSCGDGPLRWSKWALDGLEVAEEVASFEQFEELSKLYAIEAPFVARSQVELVFDVYDGRKLRQAGLMEDEGDEEEEEDRDGARASRAACGAGLQQASLDQRARQSKSQQHNFTWSRLLSFKRSQQQQPKRKSGQSPMRCCMSKSDTSNEFAASLSQSSSSNLEQTLASAHSPGLAREPNDDQEALELKEEAQRIMGPILSQLRRRSSVWASLAGSEQLSPASGLEQQQQVILETGCGQNDTSHISVCLFDKRARLVKLKREAENARRRAQAEARLEELFRFRRASLGAESGAASPKLRAQVDRMLGERLGHLRPTRDSTECEKLTSGQLTQLVDLTKNSLNHLIDAQLLLRNKLTSEQEQLQKQQLQQQQYQPQQSRICMSMEYDALLKNNFNLLKVWQNLEETKRLACFVCEPIRTNLSDLFWFSRQRPTEISKKLASPGDSLLVSPLASLDGIQVKRGLLQVLEALNYLHSICKLIHRNLTPRNILIVANGNWKLSGLEFAIRFESATISQSASIMAHEGSGSLLVRCSSGSSARATLCRQRTLHQTKCDEFIRRPRKGARVIQPEVDYLAPEIWKSAKCSHKSDMFSYGLILGQTYDLCHHKPPISCRANAQNYDSELKKLRERRARKLGRLVPFEMRSALLEMLELEPNMRPSANYAIQLFKRPIELCKVNEDSLRHLRSSLGYLDSRLINSNNINNTNGAHKKRINYFRKVTSTLDQPTNRGQTRGLHLLNLLLRGVDSLANMKGVALASASDLASDHQQPQLIFHQLKQQFELTFESLRQLYDPTTATGDTFVCADSRSTLLAVALHRRLLEQIAQMRSELPPVSRLAGPTTQTNRLTQSHRTLAELEDRLHCLVSRHSVAKLVPVLTDPMLKLEEFLLVFELVNDLLAFLGQKCRQNFTQRGKQLLNELTPVTGCPSLSSSEDEDEDSAHSDSCPRPLIGSRNLVGAGSRQTLGSRETLNNFNMNNNNSNNNSSIKSRMSHRFSAYDDSTALAAAASRGEQSRHFLNQSNLPTKISITAPSPMGSMRDVNRINDPNESLSNLEHQMQSRMQQQQAQEDQMIELSSQLGINCAISYNGPDGESVEMGSDGQQQKIKGDETLAETDNEGSKSRSQLIDELLKTINDDSFNDLVDFNNKYVGGQQLTPAQLANLNRPKSAIDGSSQARGSSSASAAGHGQQQQHQANRYSGNRPNSLALNNNQQQHSNRAVHASPSTFDNVIRRMSTNIVQNFNKMSNTNINDTQQDQSSYAALRREKSSNPPNSLYVDNQVPVRRHSDNTINVPRIQVALSSPQASKTGPNQRASVSATKLANKWKLTATTNRRESNDKLSPNLGGALGYMRRHSSGNTTGNDQSQSNGQTSNLLFNTSPFKTKSSSNLGLDFLLSNRSMKRRCSAASMLGHQTQRKAEDLIDAGMKSVQNMFN